MVSDTKAPGAEVAHFKMASALDAVTTSVMDDEMCYVLWETDLPIKGGNDDHRYQILRVVRNDRLVTAYVDMGPARNFKDVDRLLVPGGQVENGRGTAWHTVAELQDIANMLRENKPYREMEPSGLKESFSKWAEEKNRQIKHQSTFGYKGHMQRD